MQVSQITTVLVSGSVAAAGTSTRSLRSVPSYASFDSQSTELPIYQARNASQETLIVPSSPSSTISSIATTITSPLGPMHHADPSAASKTIKAICRLFPRSALAKKMEQVEVSGAVKAKKQERELSEKEQLELQAKRAAILEADRIIGHNLKQLGL